MSSDSKKKIEEIDPYTPEYIPLFELLYGKNLISLGGLASVDGMFDDIKLNTLKALDLGFGLGGIAYYLAQRHHMDVSGIEVHQWMADYANDHIPDNFTNKLRFCTYDQHGNFPYDDESFDIVYSKGVLNHVREKLGLFEQVSKVLKPGGLFIIADWLISALTPDYSGQIVSETKSSYLNVLEASGFHDISIRDEKVSFQKYVSDFLDRLNKNKTAIESGFGNEIFSTILDQHLTLQNKIMEGTKIPVRFVAKKS